MIRKIKILLVAFTALGMMAVPVTAFASETVGGQLACGAELTAADGNDCTLSSSTAASSAQTLVDDVINVFSWLVGGISVIMIIYGGFRYVTSGGNDAGVSGAK